MTSKERMLKAMQNGKPDCVPVAPDMSNMIPCRLTGKPFWDIYLYQDPPLWKAYIGAAKHFGIDGWLAGVPLQFDYEIEAAKDRPGRQEAIIKRTSERIYTRFHADINGEKHWSNYCNVYYIADPPTRGLPLAKAGLPDNAPTEWEDVHRRTNYKGLEAFHEANEYMGDDGVVGVAIGIPGLNLRNMDSIYEYYDNREKVIKRCQQSKENLVHRLKEMVKLKPDFILIGMSGHMITNPEPIFRELSLPALKELTKICKDANVTSQIHCCGPEYDLVKISARETDLCSINPLEPPPMGDCNLARLKKEFGHKIGLMGNLHTTEVMLRGTPEDVKKASMKAIDDAGENGGFILSTGDQCGRDTPDENIYAMIDTARTYGRY